MIQKHDEVVRMITHSSNTMTIVVNRRQWDSSGCLKAWLNLFEKQTKLNNLISVSIDAEA